MIAVVAVLLPAFNVPAPLAPRFAASPVATRCNPPCAQDLETAAPKKANSALTWQATQSGWKYVEDKVGTGAVPAAGDVVQLHYTVTLMSSGTVLGTSRNSHEPLTLALGKHNVPIWDEALVDMRVGGKRRMLVPPSAIPSSQAARVPEAARKADGKDIRFDIELLGTVDKESPRGVIASVLPPKARMAEIGRSLYLGLYALSFVPYFLPTEMQPKWYHDGMTREQIVARNEQRAQSQYLGGDIGAIDGLFPPETLP